tara:strand:+ start:887 stop:1384 length:498 start_codon:yes stop_codon:yes gene_type:complete
MNFGLKPYPKIGVNKNVNEKTENKICHDGVIFHGDPVSKLQDRIKRRQGKEKIYGIFQGCFYEDDLIFSNMYYGNNKEAIAFIVTDLKNRIFLIRENGNLQKNDLWKNFNLTNLFGDVKTGISHVSLDSSSTENGSDVNFLGFYANENNDIKNEKSICVVKINEK